MVSATFGSILRSGRNDFNEKFVAARRIYPELQPDEFGEFLKTQVDELVSSIEEDSAPEVAMVAYDVGLSLVGQKLAGPGARLSELNEGWRRVFPAIASVLAVSPGRIIPAISNAIYQLASTSNARPKEWIESMERLGPNCLEPDTLLKLGQVLGWRAGLAHFRESALKIADALPESIALAALGADSSGSWSTIRSQLIANPWFDPSNAANSSLGLRVVSRVGTFRGFGGPFLAPPLVASLGEQFIARARDECWILAADAFGATFHRASLREFETAPTKTSPLKELKLNRGEVSFNGSTLDVSELDAITSAAANSSTLALTSPLSHSILLVALR